MVAEGGPCKPADPSHINMSPTSSWASARRSWLRSVSAPLAIPRNTFLHPARVNWRTCASTLCPPVDTLEYP
jgi:hypothetical protein